MNITPSSELLKYYATPGPFTDPAGQAHLFDGLPSEIGELCRVVQNNLLHIFWADRYGRTLSDKEKETGHVSPALWGTSCKFNVTSAMTQRPRARLRRPQKWSRNFSATTRPKSS